MLPISFIFLKNAVIFMSVLLMTRSVKFCNHILQIYPAPNKAKLWELDYSQIYAWSNPNQKSSDSFPSEDAKAISFNESDIDEFRDCFSLFAKDKFITSSDQLALIMRSLAFSPTIYEVQRYFEEHHKNNRIDFATFIGILEKHSKVEKCQQDIVNAFRAHDRNSTGTVPASELQYILTQFGDKMSKAEVDKLFRDAGIQPTGNVRYDDIVRSLLTPLNN